MRARALATFILTRSHQLLDQKNIKHALIEGVSALEIAINNFIREKLDREDYNRGIMQKFDELPLPTKITTISTFNEEINHDDLNHTINAIDMRNKVVHEGREPIEETEVDLSRLIKIVGQLLSGPRFRFPSANPGNLITSPEEWERKY